MVNYTMHGSMNKHFLLLYKKKRKKTLIAFSFVTLLVGSLS